MAKKYTKEEIELIKKTMKYLNEDMYELVNSSGCQEMIGFPTEFLTIAEKSRIIINGQEEMWINSSYFKRSVFSHYDHYLTLWKKSIVGISTPFDPKYIDFYVELIKNYDMIRERAVVEISNEIALKIEADNQKSSDMDIVRKWYNKFKGNVDLEVDFPKSQNAQLINVEDTGTNKIGTINFGDRTIRIITEGDIILVNKHQDRPKVK